MEDIKNSFVVILTIISAVAAVPESHSFESRYGEEYVAKEDVTVDREEQYLKVKVTPIRGKLIPTTNLHDFAQGYTAVRDDERERCFIMETEHTLEEMMDKFEQSVKREGFFKVQESFKCTKKEFIPSSELYRYGDRIAEFCEDYDVVFTKKEFFKRSRRSVKMMTGYALSCGECWGFCG